MPSLTSNALRGLVLTTGASAIMAISALPSMAQQAGGAPQMPQGWYKECGKTQDFDICNVQNQVIAQTGQMLTAVQLAEFKGKVNRRALQVSVPVGRMLPAGVSMQIDGNKPTKLEFTTCFQDRCVADAPLTDALVSSLKKGTAVTLTSYNFQNQPNPIKISLEGFTGVYDGAPLNQDQSTERRKAAQDYVERNRQPLLDKLKAEQEKAKAAGSN